MGLAVLALMAFAPLAEHPDWLLADADAPGVDRARPVGTSTVGNDLTRLFLPLHLRISEVVRRTGFAPGWDPAGFGGRPLVGNPQASLWYPPVWIMWGTGRPSALGWLTVGHLVWAGVGTFVLARSRGVSVLGAFLAGSAFELSPFLLAQTMEGHLPHVWSASWYPWAFLCALGLKEGRWGRAFFLPPVLALGFLAGHPQESYYLAVTLGLGLLGAMVRWPREAAGRILAISSVVVLLTLALSAVEWLPDAQAQVWGLKRGLSPRRAAAYSVGWANLLQLIDPRALGGAADYMGETNYWDSVLSFGLVPLVLAGVAVRSGFGRRETRGWLALAVLAVAFSMGPRMGLHTIMFRVVPGMDRFRVPARALFLASLGVAMLAGLGLDLLRRQEARTRGLLALGAGVLALLVGGLVAGGGRDSSGEMASIWVQGLENLAHDPVVWAGTMVLVAVGGWLARHPQDSERAGLVLCALSLFQGVHQALMTVKVAPLERFVRSEEVVERLPEPGVSGPFRVRARDAFLDDLSAIRFGLEKTNLGDWFQVEHAAELYETLYPIFDPPRLLDLLNPLEDWQQGQVRQAVLDRMNVAFLISDRKDVNARWPVAIEDEVDGERFWIYRNPTAMPRAYVVPRVWEVADDNRTVGLMPWVPAREAVLMPYDPLEGTPGPRQPYRQARYRSDHPDRVRISVKTEAPGYLVIGDTWMPGWTGRLDGREVPVLRGNRAQRVVVIPGAGTHRLSLRYEPPGLWTGLILSGVTWVLWAGFAVRMGLRKALIGPLRPTRFACGGTTPG